MVKNVGETIEAQAVGHIVQVCLDDETNIDSDVYAYTISLSPAGARQLARELEAAAIEAEMHDGRYDLDTGDLRWDVDTQEWVRK